MILIFLQLKPTQIYLILTLIWKYMMFIGSNLVKHVDQNLSVTTPTVIEMIFTKMSIITQHFYNIILINVKVPDHQKFNFLLNFPIQLTYLKRNLPLFSEKHQIFPLLLPEHKTPDIVEDYNHEKFTKKFILILQFQEDSPIISRTVFKSILPLKKFKTPKKSRTTKGESSGAFNIEYQPILEVPILVVRLVCNHLTQSQTLCFQPLI